MSWSGFGQELYPRCKWWSSSASVKLFLWASSRDVQGSLSGTLTVLTVNLTTTETALPVPTASSARCATADKRSEVSCWFTSWPLGALPTRQPSACQLPVPSELYNSQTQTSGCVIMLCPPYTGCIVVLLGCLPH